MSYVSATNLKDRDIDVLVTVFLPPHFGSEECIQSIFPHCKLQRLK